MDLCVWMRWFHFPVQSVFSIYMNKNKNKNRIMKVKNGINGTNVPTADDAWKMYNFINDWKRGCFGICDLDMAITGYYENYKCAAV